MKKLSVDIEGHCFVFAMLNVFIVMLSVVILSVVAPHKLSIMTLNAYAKCRYAEYRLCCLLNLSVSLC
jgi:hypothetical protein